jgi:hypothetical protein
MRKAIEAPAHRAGLALEPGLADLILHDAAGAPGALPLMQYVLRALWERRQQGYLTVEGYHAIGGLTGSLARDADAFFSSLSSGDREVAMAVLLRLVRVTIDGAIVRRVAKFAELAGPAAQVRRVLDALVAARLVVVSSDVLPDATIDLAHEAIINSWPTFREQIERVTQFLRSRTRLEAAAQRWQELSKNAGFLYPEGEIQLLKGEGMLERYWNELSPAELEFITASEQALHRRRRRRQNFTAALAVSAVLMAGFAGLATYNRSVAEQQRAIAEQQRADAERQKAIAERQRAIAEQQKADAEQ